MSSLHRFSGILVVSARKDEEPHLITSEQCQLFTITSKQCQLPAQQDANSEEYIPLDQAVQGFADLKRRRPPRYLCSDSSSESGR